MARFRSIDLTSPRHHGGHVAEAQHLLQGHNRWDQHFYNGPLDGIYGEKTAAATRRAKYYLGYPRAHINALFGHSVYSYLVGKNHAERQGLPPDYKVRKKNRAHDLVVKRDWHDHVIAEMRKHLHETEHPPNSNQTVFNKWYYGRMIAGPWCAMFESYCIQHAGGPKWFKYAYCPYILRDAQDGKNGMHVTHSPGEGATVLYDWDNDGIADHTECFIRWIAKGQTFMAIGGNTGPVDRSNGGQVIESQRFVSDVQAFVHVP